MPNRRRQRFRVPVEFDQWIAGLDNFDPGDEILDEWRLAMERFYGHTQETVHVISNDLRQSGRHDTTRVGASRVEGELTYGGTPECDYAIYEHNRGGDHAWITVAFARSRDDFERALLAGIESHVRTFL